MPTAKVLTQRQTDQRERVLETTRQMLARDGYEGLQMRAVADAAGVALMTIYNRLGNKDDLILLALEDMLADLAVRASAEGGQGIAMVVRNAEIIAEQILQTPKYAQAMALMLFNGQPESPIVQALLANNIEQSRARLDEMEALGEISGGMNRDVLARNLGVCTWSTILLWMKGFIDDDKFLTEYRRAPLRVLASAMTPAARRKYAADLQ